MTEIRPTVARYKILFEQGRVTAEGLKNVVPKLINAEEYEYITGIPYTE